MPIEKQVEFKKLADALPFQTFAELQQSLKDKKVSFGVDPLAAAEWSAVYNSRVNKIFISSLSVLLILAALAAILVALVTREFRLLLAVPIQIVVFYLANANSAIRLWVTVGGVVSLIFFFNLLLNDMPIAATLVAYAGLTFAAVRASSSLMNASFRKALASSESLFIQSFMAGACTVRNNRTKTVYQHQR
ncbi:MAG: hypothetical protein AB1757_18745 [Acidobacteriota bacterium]